MEIAWYILAVIVFFTFAGILDSIAEAQKRTAAAWEHYFGDNANKEA